MLVRGETDYSRGTVYLVRNYICYKCVIVASESGLVGWFFKMQHLNLVSRLTYFATSSWIIEGNIQECPTS